jgi:hypothetical protein
MYLTMATNPIIPEHAPKPDDERFSARPSIVLVPAVTGPAPRTGGPIRRWLAARHEATCECGHPHELHEHHRPGSDCSLCLCGRFRRS